MRRSWREVLGRSRGGSGEVLEDLWGGPEDLRGGRGPPEGDRGALGSLLAKSVTILFGVVSSPPPSSGTILGFGIIFKAFFSTASVISDLIALSTIGVST